MAGRTRLLSNTAWNVAGPFADVRESVFDKRFGPEEAPLDFTRRFGELAWNAEIKFKDGATNATPDGVGATYVAKRIFSPSARAPSEKLRASATATKARRPASVMLPTRGRVVRGSKVRMARRTASTRLVQAQSIAASNTGASSCFGPFGFAAPGAWMT